MRVLIAELYSSEDEAGLANNSKTTRALKTATGNVRSKNGIGYSPSPRHSKYEISYDEALKLILACETSSKLAKRQRKELSAIVSHWLQATDAAPLLLDKTYHAKWLTLIRSHCEMRNQSLGSALPAPSHKPHSIRIDYSGVPFPPPAEIEFNFIDLFAGIGGFRIALQELGGKCLFSSEWDRHATETYYRNYGEIPFGDITKLTKLLVGKGRLRNVIPPHDILCGGFPCQPFSQAGLQRGFDDARGTLFFDILTITRALKPKVLLLENVKRLKTHDGGNTFKTICCSLKELGYKVYSKVLKAYDYGVPQNRERIFIVAFSEPLQFNWPKPTLKPDLKVGEILESDPPSKFTISDAMWHGHNRRRSEHRRKGNGFGFSLFTPTSKYVNTISARYWKDGSEVLIDQPGNNPRVLTPRECARMQGFPDVFLHDTSNRYAYQQFGNSVAVPVVHSVATAILSALKNRKPVHNRMDPLDAVIE